MVTNIENVHLAFFEKEQTRPTFEKTEIQQTSFTLNEMFPGRRVDVPDNHLSTPVH